MEMVIYKMYTFHDVIFLSVGIEWDMIVERVFLSILNQMETHLVQNRKVNCHHDHIPFNLKGNGIRVFSVQLISQEQKLLSLSK